MGFQKRFWLVQIGTGEKEVAFEMRIAQAETEG